jgi:SAM-dependent methyltransferase
MFITLAQIPSVLMPKSSTKTRYHGSKKIDLPMRVPGLILNLGSGKDWNPEYLNADILSSKTPDWLVDISNIKWGDTLETRFGQLEVVPGMFETILANDVLEHIPNLVDAMTNCKELLKVGGEMRIHVPYDLSLGAWQDPTHVRAFNENSWRYYTDWHWYLGWPDRFELTTLEMRLSKVGESLELPHDEIIRTPRAVDSMYVVLTKVKP